MVKFPDKCESQKGFKPDIKVGLASYTNGSKTSKGTGVGVYRWGSRMEHRFSLGLHTTIFQAEIYAINACLMENTEEDYMCRNIYILSDVQAAIKVLDIGR
jgi:hypothetical protein